MSLLTAAYADSSLGVLTPEGIEFALFPAGLPIRACAYGIDKMIQWLLTALLFLASGVLRDAAGMWLTLILLFGVDWFYHCACELFFRGQSPGKRIMGIRVVRDDGSPVSPGASFLRNLLRFADTFLFLPVAFISMAASRGFRRLGDWAAGTLVVYTPKALALPRYSGGPGPAEFAPLVPPAGLSHEEKRAILMFARRYPLLGAARAEEIARPYVSALGAALGAVPGAAPGAGGPSAPAYLLGIARKLAGETP